MISQEEVAAVAAGLKTLERVLRRLRWDDQGGFPGYRGDGKWAFISTGLPQVSPEELNELLALAGITPDKIIPKGSCKTCKHAVNGQERGYVSPCGPCKRPLMSNYEKKEGA